MKKLVTLVYLFACLSTALAQSWTSSSRITSTADIFEINSVIDESGNVTSFGVFTGQIESSSGEILNSFGGRDYYIARFDIAGDVIWMRQLGGSSNEYFLGGISSDNANIYVTGGFRNFLKFDVNDSIQSGGGDDIFLAKYDLLGNIAWCINAGTGNGNQRPTALAIDSNSDLILGGFFADSISVSSDTTIYSYGSTMDVYLSKHSAENGDLIWAKGINTLNGSSTGRISNISEYNNELYLSGTFRDSIRLDSDTIVSYNSSLDVHLINTDIDGNVQWVRTAQGDVSEYCYSQTIDNGSIYLGGYYNSPTLTIAESEDTYITIDSVNADYDCFFLSYTLDGTLNWNQAIGGKGDDKVFNVEYFDDALNCSGYFADTVSWGSVELTSNGINDTDMFIGSFDNQGNFRSANSFSGEDATSTEEGRAIFTDGISLHTIIRSNANLLVLGDSIYTQTGGNYFIAIGIIGCLPISVDNTIYNDITTCYGDSTGSIQISASGGFGDPWIYSIDNGLNSSATPFFANLPAGDYQIVVVDEEGCAQTGPLVTLTQPDTLLPTVNLKDDIYHFTNWKEEVTITPGSLTITASGGTGPYTYTLIPAGGPPGSPSALGTFNFPLEADSGKYVVALNDIRNCGPSETDTVEINVIYDSQVSIEGIAGIEVKMYPNPTSGIFTLEMPFDKVECSMEVLNMSGQVVLQQQIYPNSGMISEVIDLSKVPKGLYLLRIDNRALQSAIVVK